MASDRQTDLLSNGETKIKWKNGCLGLCGRSRGGQRRQDLQLAMRGGDGWVTAMKLCAVSVAGDQNNGESWRSRSPPPRDGCRPGRGGGRRRRMAPVLPVCKARHLIMSSPHPHPHSCFTSAAKSNIKYRSAWSLNQERGFASPNTLTRLLPDSALHGNGGPSDIDVQHGPAEADHWPSLPPLSRL